MVIIRMSHGAVMGIGMRTYSRHITYRVARTWNRVDDEKTTKSLRKYIEKKNSVKDPPPHIQFVPRSFHTGGEKKNARASIIIILFYYDISGLGAAQ